MEVTISNKKTGDQFTAAEVNQVVNAMNTLYENTVYADNFIAGSLTAGIQEAHDYGVAQGWDRFTIIGPSGTHVIHKGAVLTTPCILWAYNTTLTFSDYQNLRTLTSDAALGTNQVTVDSVANLEVGWAVAAWNEGNFSTGQVDNFTITAINGNTVTLSGNLSRNLNTADGAVICHIHDAVTTLPGDYEQYGIFGLRVEGNPSSYDGTRHDNKHTWVQNVVSIGAFGELEEDEVLYIVSDCYFNNIVHTAMNVHGRGGVVRNCHFRNVGSHGIDCGDASPMVTGCYFENCGYTGIFFCLNLWNINIVDNEFYRCNYGIWGIGSSDSNRVPELKDAYHNIANCIFDETEKSAIAFANYPRGVGISNCIFKNGNQDTQDDYYAVNVYRGQDIIINGCRFIDDQAISTQFKDGGIFISQAQGSNVVVDACTFMNWEGNETEDVGVSITSGFVQVFNCAFKGAFVAALHVNAAPVTVNGCQFDVSNNGNLVGGNAFRVQGDVSGVTLINNRIKAESAGFYMYPTGGAISDYNISNNQFIDCRWALRAWSGHIPTNFIFMSNSASGCTEDYDFAGNYPTSYKPDIGGADFKADVEQFNFGTVTAS